MTIRVFLSFNLFFIFIFWQISAQQYLFDVEHINVEDGLPHRSTYDMLQDKEGFIWISTPGMISRFDGERFKTFNAAQLNISDTSPCLLALDKEGNIWYNENPFIAEKPESGIINTRNLNIQNLNELLNLPFQSNEIYRLYNADLDKKSILILTNSGKAYLYADDFEKVFDLPSISPVPYLILSMPNGSYWAANEYEIMNIKGGKVIQSYKLPEAPRQLLRRESQIIIELHTNSRSIRYQTIQDQQLVPFSLPNYQPDELMGLFQFHEDYTLFATPQAYTVQNKAGELIFEYDDFEKFGLGNYLEFQQHFKDNQGIVWISTENGIIKINPSKNPFTILEAGNSTRAIYKSTNHFWIGGYFRNTKTNLKTNEEEVFFLKDVPVTSFFKDTKNDLWIGSSQRFLIHYNETSNQFTTYTDSSVMREFLVPFWNEVTNKLWIGTNAGLMTFDVNKSKAIPFSLPTDNEKLHVKQILNQKDDFWVVSNQGIFVMDKATDQLLHHYAVKSGLPYHNFHHVYRDSASIYWLATKGSGLIKWDFANNEFKQYGLEEGLFNNVIYAVYEDDFNNLWLPSDYGLMLFDKETAITKVFLSKNGIAHNEFNTYSHFQDENGTMYFGGLKGVTKFHPRDVLKMRGYASPLYVNKIKVLEQNAEHFTDKTNEFLDNEQLLLQPKDRMLELEISLLDFEKTDDNQYAYKVEGYQNQWIYTKESKISLINLPHGNFNLKIKGRGSSGSWSEQELSIPLTVLAPVYLRWWFMVLAVMSIFFIAFLVFRWRIILLKKDQQRLEKAVKERTLQIEKDKATIADQAEALQALDVAKTRFFSNITHEFRTPLTLIIGPIETLMENDFSRSVKKKLSIVRNNAKHLLLLINQLLDLSKIESGRMELEVTRGDIIKQTEKLLHRFDYLADKKNQRLAFVPHQKNWAVHFDKNKWDKIVYNLISNAVKFTPKNGAIQVNLASIKKEQKEYISLEVKDTGIGINHQHIDKIFNRFYQQEASSTRMQEGTGIGLSLVKELVALQGGTINVQSEVGLGTIFYLEIPVLTQAKENAVKELPNVNQSFISLPYSESQKPQTVNRQNGKVEKLELLIVEDNAEMREYISYCIDENKYNITEAIDGEEGIRKAIEAIPDLIISDVMMPKKNGYQLTKAIRNNIKTSHIPIVLLTAKAALESRLKGYERGADAYLTKPFSPKELSLRIDKLIEIRQLLQNCFRHAGTPFPALNSTAVPIEREDEFLQSVKKIIIDNISSHQLNADFIAKRVTMSRMQLHRKIKALTNQATGEFIREVRLQEAYQLLVNTKGGVADIAYRTGFNTPGYFSRTFKKRFKVTPSDLNKNE